MNRDKEREKKRKEGRRGKGKREGRKGTKEKREEIGKRGTRRKRERERVILVTFSPPKKKLMSLTADHRQSGTPDIDR